MVYLLKTVIFYSYVILPEGTWKRMMFHPRSFNISILDGAKNMVLSFQTNGSQFRIIWNIICIADRYFFGGMRKNKNIFWFLLDGKSSHGLRRTSPMILDIPCGFHGQRNPQSIRSRGEQVLLLNELHSIIQTNDTKTAGNLWVGKLRGGFVWK